MQIKGKLHVKQDIKQVSDTFKKREFVIEYAENPMYPQYISLQLVQDKCDLIERFNAGDMLNVEFNLNGREWTSPQGEVKYFNSLDAWRINPVNDAQPPAKEPVLAVADVLDVTQMDDDEDDLPF